MPPQLSSLRLVRSIFSVLFLVSINSGVAKAQIIPDSTLPTNVEQLENMQKIRGGERVGDNLFHSFEKFSIPAGMEAIFENAPDIQNIFTRITGSEISLIDGLLQTAGGANFFLVNPNGIVFGENAQIDIGGSFIATTANSIEFGDGTSFAAHGDEPNVTLTISVPIGLGFYGNNGSITVNGTENQITNDSNFLPIEFSQRPSGISAPDGQTIALIGNGINLNGGVVTTEGGNIYISSVESGSVGISQAENGLTLLNDQVNNYQDINLIEQSLIDASGEKVGNIFVSGQNIYLGDGSVVLSQNQGDLPGGSINIQASESITFSGTSPNGEIVSILRTENLSDTGEGSDINISANKLSLQDTSKIQAFTFSEALGGNVKVKTHEAVTLNNSLINAGTRGEGNSGNLELSTSQLTISDGGIITTSTFGTGNGGEVSIEADLIEVIGNTNVSRGSRSNISASSFSSSQDRPGNAGNLNINTQQLRIKDGGAVSSSSFGTGNGGNISINASELITVSGKDNNTSSRSPESTIRTAVQLGPSGRIVPTGTAGSLTINTPVLNVTQEGVITVGNQGTGSAGKLEINANNLNLDQSGSLTSSWRGTRRIPNASNDT